MGSPQLSDLGNSATFREEPIHIEFSAKEPSASDRCIADVILFKLACEAEMKIYGDDEEYQDQLKSAKKQWLKANNLYKLLLEERSSVIGGSGSVEEVDVEDSSSLFQHSSLKKLAPRPKKRR